MQQSLAAHDKWPADEEHADGKYNRYRSVTPSEPMALPSVARQIEI
jgi:hypothetical protein